jgi:ubiquinone/menaquinone biosynthesis C-methylase UbiE
MEKTRMDQQADHIDANRRKWDRRSETLDSRYSSYLRAIQEKTLAELGLRPGYRLLDAGCGTGWAVRRAADLSDRQGEFYGVDLSPRMIEKAQAKSEGFDGVHFLQANSEDLPLDDAFFDGIICTNSFHHYPNPAAALGEFRRVLKPGGRLHIADVASDGPLMQMIDQWVKGREREHVRFYSTPEIQALFAPSGLRYVDSPSIMGPVKLHIAQK